MRQKIKIGKEKFDYTKIDKDELKETVRKARFALHSLETNAQRGSILIDIDYGELHEAVEALYTIAQIGELAEDNAKRKAVEDKQLKEKGLSK